MSVDPSRMACLLSFFFLCGTVPALKTFVCIEYSVLAFAAFLLFKISDLVLLQAPSFCHVVHFSNAHLAELVAAFLLVQMEVPLGVLLIAALA